MVLQESGRDGRSRALTPGNRRGGAFARIYDKRREQMRKGVDLQASPKSWVRWETAQLPG